MYNICFQSKKTIFSHKKYDFHFQVIKAFSKNSELKGGNSLVIDVKTKVNVLNFNYQVMDQIFSDTRVLKFMNAITQIH
ncbi:hypothetical protein RTB9991CWPP_01035 [Rickettsia typhi str. B9991CWPP]|uniref:Uncharacterized protein n=1 Tax=Rickettsia typhi str. TH1527 TaxID=1003201 RepID=A0ABM5MTM5_RICTP|nr:hypothetical protein RTTH1527_01030 [Rickettsia typhi str. TH1527]AFE54910.1 hypothetical protein RTB9991CWPP_01035 [Rickettsia typhi str. B9991CWPP]